MCSVFNDKSPVYKMVSDVWLTELVVDKTVMEALSSSVIPSEIQERHQVMMESIEDIMTTTAVDQDARQKGAISSLPGYT